MRWVNLWWCGCRTLEFKHCGTKDCIRLMWDELQRTRYCGQYTCPKNKKKEENHLSYEAAERVRQWRDKVEGQGDVNGLDQNV